MELLLLLIGTLGALATWWIVSWLLFGILAAIIAHHKERSRFAWFMLAALIGPFALLVAVLPSADAIAERRARNGEDNARFRRCFACREPVRSSARVCKHCGAALPIWFDSA